MLMGNWVFRSCWTSFTNFSHFRKKNVKTHQNLKVESRQRWLPSNLRLLKDLHSDNSDYFSPSTIWLLKIGKKVYSSLIPSSNPLTCNCPDDLTQEPLSFSPSTNYTRALSPSCWEQGPPGRHSQRDGDRGGWEAPQPVTCEPETQASEPSLELWEQSFDVHRQGKMNVPAQEECSIWASRDRAMPTHLGGQTLLTQSLTRLPTPSQTHPEIMPYQLPRCPLAQASRHTKLAATPVQA